MIDLGGEIYCGRAGYICQKKQQQVITSVAVEMLQHAGSGSSIYVIMEDLQLQGYSVQYVSEHPVWQTWLVVVPVKLSHDAWQ